MRGTGVRGRCVHGDLSSIPAPAASADVVIAAEVLEHATDPQRSVAELLRVLRPGGWLAISLPIDLDIAMHPTVFASQAEIHAFFERAGSTCHDSVLVVPDASIDAIADVFPGFQGCANLMLRKPTT